MRLAVTLLVVTVATALVAGCAGSDDSTSFDFAADVEPIGWVLSDGIDVEGSEQVQPDIVFENGGIEGSAGCNEFIASYTVDASALDLELGAMTDLACPGPRGEVETAYLAALEDVAGWALEDGELVLLDASNQELLRFKRRPGT